MEMKCPACGTINREKTWQCFCGHYFVTSQEPKETPFPAGQTASQAASKETASIPGEPAAAIPKREQEQEPRKETPFPAGQIGSQAASKQTASIPGEPAAAPPKEKRAKFNYRWARYRLFGRGVVKVTLLLLAAALWITGGVVLFPDLLDDSLPILLVFVLLFSVLGPLLFWITNLLSELLIGEKTCYLTTSRFWSYETERLIHELRLRERERRGIQV